MVIPVGVGVVAEEMGAIFHQNTLCPTDTTGHQPREDTPPLLLVVSGEGQVAVVGLLHFPLGGERKERLEGLQALSSGLLQQYNIERETNNSELNSQV